MPSSCKESEESDSGGTAALDTADAEGATTEVAVTEAAAAEAVAVTEATLAPPISESVAATVLEELCSFVTDTSATVTSAAVGMVLEAVPAPVIEQV